ncbi:MAG TPA: hypothetical protein VFW38_04210 [Solirubrobacteraceae bacterium]|nr:hypothetical protein [Solirubrobacteraceae bacterium]
MSEFQERLWSELVRDHAAALACPAGVGDPWPQLPILERRRTRLLSLPALRPRHLAGAVAAALTLAIAVTVATVTSSPSSAAYAVTRHPDGTVTVSLSEMIGVSGADEQLEKLGVPVRVVPIRAGCPVPTGIVPMPPSLWSKLSHGERQGILIQPNLIPAGETLVLTARQVGPFVGLTTALYKGSPPTCVSPGVSHVD